MTHLRFPVLFALILATLLASCATSPDGTAAGSSLEAVTSPEEQVAQLPAAEQADAEDVQSTPESPADDSNTTGDQESSGSEGTTDAESEGNGTTDQGETAVESASEPTEPPEPAAPPPVPSPAITLSPNRPAVGDVISVTVQDGIYDKITYDFGAGPSEANTHAYSRFGVKGITVTGSIGDRGASSTVDAVVTGFPQLELAAASVQHDAGWSPVLPARLTADGDFDTIVIYQGRQEIFRIPPPESYKIPVPFVGTREFSAALLHRGKEVGRLVPVEITGLNRAPKKPVIESPQFLTVQAGDTVEFTVTAEDPNYDPVIYEVKFAPEGSEFDATTGVFTWTPTTRQRSLFLLSFYAIDQPYGEISTFVQRGIIVQ